MIDPRTHRLLRKELKFMMGKGEDITPKEKQEIDYFFKIRGV